MKTASPCAPSSVCLSPITAASKWRKPSTSVVMVLASPARNSGSPINTSWSAPFVAISPPMPGSLTANFSPKIPIAWVSNFIIRSAIGPSTRSLPAVNRSPRIHYVLPLGHKSPAYPPVSPFPFGPVPILKDWSVCLRRLCRGCFADRRQPAQPAGRQGTPGCQDVR